MAKCTNCTNGKITIPCGASHTAGKPCNLCSGTYRRQINCGVCGGSGQVK